MPFKANAERRHHIPKQRHRTTNSAAYDAALHQRGSLTVWFIVGLDGGYVRDWDDRRANFELIVGRSMPDDRDPRYVGLVHGYDPKPKRRLFELLKAQGLQANQDVTFLTDGGRRYAR